jgi:hypothetical protein
LIIVRISFGLRCGQAIPRYHDRKRERQRRPRDFTRVIQLFANSPASIHSALFTDSPLVMLLIRLVVLRRLIPAV